MLKKKAAKRKEIALDLFPLSRRVHISASRTVSKDYQSRKYEFGFEANLMGVEIADAFDLCEAVVLKRIGHKTGHTRARLNKLATRFMGCSWEHLCGEVPRDDEEV